MAPEHVDVLIVGAGISGVGAACRLTLNCPDRTFAIVEARGAIGGTWDTFRFPGVRSDTDMYTLSYPFRPWSGSQVIVDGASIRRYVNETADEFGIRDRIRFHHRVVGAEWSSEDARWTVDLERGETGERVQMTCGFLYSCTGLYRHEQGFAPEFAGMERFRGEIVHPQFWGDDIDHAGKRVVVIGSGATAVTTIPAIAQTAAHVTMLQRSPSYIISLPGSNPVIGALGRVLPARIAYPIVRWIFALIAIALYAFSRRRPEATKRVMRSLVKRKLPKGYDVDKHFKPRYQPWDERVCIVPDDDLFEAISAGRVSVVTDRIETFTETGIALESGDHLEADMIVTATGLQLVPFGEMRLTVDGDEVEISRTVSYQGMLLGGVPNFAYALGYINQSWTLGADLSSEHVCRLLNHMDRHGYSACTPRSSAVVPADPAFAALSSGYVRRGIHQFPREGAAEPWKRPQNWVINRRSLRRARFDDTDLEFRRAASVEPVAA